MTLVIFPQHLKLLDLIFFCRSMGANGTPVPTCAAQSDCRLTVNLRTSSRRYRHHHSLLVICLYAQGL